MKKIIAVIFIAVLMFGCAPKEVEDSVFGPDDAVKAVNAFNGDIYMKDSDTHYISKSDSTVQIEYTSTFAGYHEVMQYKVVAGVYEGDPGYNSTLNCYYVEIETGRVIPKYFEGYTSNPEWDSIFMGDW